MKPLTYHNLCSSCLHVSLTIAGGAAFLAVPAARAAEDRPNFLFVYTDDQRQDAMGVVQREQGDHARFPSFQTPNMDRLANEGVRFRNAFVTLSLCSPSRAVFLTGRYNHLNGYDESLRIPMIVRYPKLFPKGVGQDKMVLNIDLAPTFLDLAGVEVPAKMQGRSWVTLLTGKAAVGSRC
ncbi:MAG TPA: sulfatase-like hydrolase/transferase [Phycisphaerae bacterium]|nr:sulfatase-like hydrolase/transferase [Phycisphaerae bacterium]HRY71458.1 sulfatase-like hydrolase/transferase [Phycisphaerae bacterium]